MRIQQVIETYRVFTGHYDKSIPELRSDGVFYWSTTAGKNYGRVGFYSNEKGWRNYLYYGHYD